MHLTIDLLTNLNGVFTFSGVFYFFFFHTREFQAHVQLKIGLKFGFRGGQINLSDGQLRNNAQRSGSEAENKDGFFLFCHFPFFFLEKMWFLPPDPPRSAQL